MLEQFGRKEDCNPAIQLYNQDEFVQHVAASCLKVASQDLGCDLGILDQELLEKK